MALSAGSGSLLKLSSSEHNDQSLLSCVLELDVLAQLQHWVKYRI